MKNITQLVQNLLFSGVFITSGMLHSQVGIGTTTPSSQLEVTESSHFNSSGGTYNFRIDSDSQNGIFFSDGANNNLGINTITPGSQLFMYNNAAVGANTMAEFENQGPNGVATTGRNTDATNGFNGIEGSTTGTQAGVWGLHNSLTNFGYGGFFSTNNPVGAWGAYVSGDFNVTGTYYNVSDERFKKDITNISNILDKIIMLTPKSYKFKQKENPGLSIDKNKLHYGFIAQDLKQVFPNLVNSEKAIPNPTKVQSPESVSDNVTGYHLVDYMGLIPVLTKGIQEQQQMINNQTDKIKSLEEKIAILDAKINALIKD